MRIKRGTTTKKSHKKILKDTKGYRLKGKNTIKLAKIRRIKAGVNSYIHRRVKKRDFRQLWTQRINAAARMNGMNYSTFIHGLKKSKIDLNRPVLSELAIHNPEAFSKLVEIAKAA